MGTLALLLMLVVLWYVLLRCTRDAEAARSEAASLVFVVVFLWYRTPIQPDRLVAGRVRAAAARQLTLAAIVPSSCVAPQVPRLLHARIRDAPVPRRLPRVRIGVRGELDEACPGSQRGLQRGLR